MAHVDQDRHYRQRGDFTTGHGYTNNQRLEGVQRSPQKRALSSMTMNGLHYRRIHGPLRLGNINDASHISGHSLYAQEAKMVLLQADSLSVRDAP